MRFIIKFPVIGPGQGPADGRGRVACVGEQCSVVLCNLHCINQQSWELLPYRMKFAVNGTNSYIVD